MPKLLHEVVAHLVRAAPEALVRLLPPALTLQLPITTKPRVTAAELPDLQLTEYRADAILLFGAERSPSAAIVVEAQTDFDRRKLYTLPTYWTLARARFECPVLVVMIALDPVVAAAYRRPIDLGFGQGQVTPYVVSAADIPVISDPDAARACPQLAVLSAVAHGHEPGAEYIARAAFAAIPHLDSQSQLLYPDAIQAHLGELARLALEQLMRNDGTHPYQSEFARRYYDQGMSEGLAGGKSQMLLRLLQRKGFTVPLTLQARITACRDLDQIETWFDRVLTAQALTDVFPDAD